MQFVEGSRQALVQQRSIPIFMARVDPAPAIHQRLDQRHKGFKRRGRASLRGESIFAARLSLLPSTAPRWALGRRRQRRTNKALDSTFATLDDGVVVRSARLSPFHQIQPSWLHSKVAYVKPHSRTYLAGLTLCPRATGASQAALVSRVTRLIWPICSHQLCERAQAHSPAFPPPPVLIHAPACGNRPRSQFQVAAADDRDRFGSQNTHT